MGAMDGNGFSFNHVRRGSALSASDCHSGRGSLHDPYRRGVTYRPLIGGDRVFTPCGAVNLG